MLNISENQEPFPIPRYPGRMLAGDLKAANIAEEMGGKYVDFHALRHTAITRVMRASGNLRCAQTFAGHSMPVLTGRYAYVSLDDMASALAGLPALGGDLCALNHDGVQRTAQRAGAMESQPETSGHALLPV